MRALDNTTIMNTIDNWKITNVLGNYYEDHGMGMIIGLACAIGVFLGVIILVAMECVGRCRSKASAHTAQENSAQ